ncbi:DASH complex subunit Dad2-domain-containing protein [Xylariaceae sp. FL0804]|nr:DASH complex subunit Dad2-domain-containing protein [Xylariaceae sp. FL0804]
MAYSTRSVSGHLRQSSVSSNPNAPSTGQSTMLLARINEKKAELDNLKELRDLSAAVADQMEALEQKLATLSDGTEAIATVVGNWHNVLQAINMASGAITPSGSLPNQRTLTMAAKIPNPGSGDGGETGAPERPMPLPQTLVRIPTEHAPTLQAHADEAMLEGEQNDSPGS